MSTPGHSGASDISRNDVGRRAARIRRGVQRIRDGAASISFTRTTSFLAALSRRGHLSESPLWNARS